jgi:hypothetical protein
MASGSTPSLSRPRRDPCQLFIASLFGTQVSQRHEPSQEVRFFSSSLGYVSYEDVDYAYFYIWMIEL